MVVIGRYYLVLAQTVGRLVIDLWLVPYNKKKFEQNKGIQEVIGQGLRQGHAKTTLSCITI